MIALLPQQEPFRFVDGISRYQPQESLEAFFRPGPLRDKLGRPSYVPDTCLIEGLAQATVIFTQLETEPVRPGELPLLGSIDAKLIRSVSWNERLTYQVRPIRMLKRRAILEGMVLGGGEEGEDPGTLVATAIIGVVIAQSAVLKQKVSVEEAEGRRV